MKFLLPILFLGLPALSVAQGPSAAAAGAPSVAVPNTTEVMVMQTAKRGITAEQVQQIMTLMPAEIRATVKLYFDGKIRQWYSRGDGRGVVFFINAKTVEEARAIMETLPLAKEQLMDNEYITVGPLVLLRALSAPGAMQ